MTPTLHVRPATPDDMAFVTCTWVNSYGGMIRGSARKQAKVAFRRSYVEPILREGPRIVVLCSPENPRALHGHAVATSGVLGWVYVPLDLRRSGYGRQLITEALGWYPDRITTHSLWPFESDRFIFRKYERGHRAA